MNFQEMIKNYPEYVEGQARKTRSEMGEIKVRLASIDRDLKKTGAGEDSLSRKISEAKDSQANFGARVEEIAQSLRLFKMRLAQYQS